MGSFKQLCREMAANPDIMTFSDIARAAADGVVIGKKFHSLLMGAVLNVSLEAGKRAVHITEKLITEFSSETEEVMSTQCTDKEDEKKPTSAKPKLRRGL